RSNTMAIAVFIEVREGQAKKGSLEALSEARRQADQRGEKVTAVVVGSPSNDAIAKVSGYKPDRVVQIDEPAVANYSAQAYSAALAAAVRQEDANVVFVSATAMGKEVAARTAAKFQTSVLADVIVIEWKDGLKARRPVYSGKAFAEVEAKGTPVFVSLRPNVFSIASFETSSKPEVQKISAGITEDQIKGHVTAVNKTEGETIELAEAEIIVSGGRGLKGPE